MSRQRSPRRRARSRSTIGFLFFTFTLGALAAPLRAGATDLVFARDDTGGALAREAVALCMRAVTVQGDERTTLLEQGLAVAERAVAASDRDAKAHFAIFCNLGRKLESEGPSLAALAEVKRVRAAVDRAIALEPNFVDALIAKGAMLVRLPAMLGGDADEGERLIRQAVELAPDYPQARLQLAKVLAEKGDAEAALSEARSVIALAPGKREASEAVQLAHELGS
ncbi:MAG TPA: tetratricopeptide repeat protein [Candidatus Binatia bacterium]